MLFSSWTLLMKPFLNAFQLECAISSFMAPQKPKSIFWCFCLFRATPVVYVNSQARGPMAAAAACWPTSQPQQCGIRAAPATCITAHWNAGSFLNPLSAARDGTHNLMDTSHVLICWATTRTPKSILSIHVTLLKMNNTEVRWVNMQRKRMESTSLEIWQMTVHLVVWFLLPTLSNISKVKPIKYLNHWSYQAT